MTAKHISSQTTVDYHRRVCRAMNYISHHVQDNISLEDVAKEASFSPYHVHRIFKAVVGETVAEFTRRVRLEAAANHLVFYADTDITSIAMDFGFSSSQNFAKAFRAQFGYSQGFLFFRRLLSGKVFPYDIGI